ncbi:MAG: tRNA lysidine(34) synthetase TilS, partial [Candidatus Mariimomonas ferrooxydans]
MNLLKAALNTINKFSMLTGGDSVLIGLSGGPDSVCLLIILDKLKEDFGLTLSAVYVDHGLRPDEVEHEISFCKKLCSSLGITFFSKSVDVREYAKKKRLSKQEAARELRYQVFEAISGDVNATKISLAHNADDQAETFLMRLLRGSGPKGLSCIPPVRGKIIRPLIEIEKGEIENFLIQNSPPVPDYSSLPFVVDSSNRRTDYLRNWIRHKIMPELRKQNPALVKTICRVADILHEEDMYLDTVVNNTLMKLISRKRDDELELFLVPLENMKKPVLRRVIRWTINETRGLKGIDFDH